VAVVVGLKDNELATAHSSVEVALAALPSDRWLLRVQRDSGYRKAGERGLQESSFRSPRPRLFLLFEQEYAQVWDGLEEARHARRASRHWLHDHLPSYFHIQNHWQSQP
jgi:hypothetical protein